MPTYDYKCSNCEQCFEIQKSIKDPPPSGCPFCDKSGHIERVFAPVNITYADRPPWTYNDFVKYKTCSHNGGPRTKIDPGKHGDLAAWNSPGELASASRADREKSAKKKEVLAKGGYMSDANKVANGN